MLNIAKKELVEWFTAGAMGRWGRFEFLVAIVAIALIPAFLMHRFAGLALCGYSIVLPLMMTAGAMADSIAGERERGTLQMLFLLPVSDSEILLGKIGGSVIYTLILSYGGLTVGTLALLFRGEPLPPLWLYGLTVLASPLFALFFSACVGWVSLGDITVRQAQTYGYAPFYVLLLLAMGLHQLTPAVFSDGTHLLAIVFAAYPVLAMLLGVLAFVAIDGTLVRLCVSRLRRSRCAI